MSYGQPKAVGECSTLREAKGGEPWWSVWK
jgi:hypothetical protein